MTWQAKGPYEIATIIAEIGDWEWDGLDGYKNKDPQLPEKLKIVMGSLNGLIKGGGQSNEAGAQAVAFANA